MCHKAFYAFLPTLTFVPDCFVTTKIIEKLYNVIVSNYLVDLHGKDSDCIIFFGDEMCLNTMNE